MNALKMTFKNPIGKIFLISFIITGVIYYVQWISNKPIKEIIPIMVVHDTIKVKDITEKNIVNKRIGNERPSQRKPNHNIITGEVLIKKSKIDTTIKAKNLVTAPNYGNQQVGNNNTQNNIGKLDHHPQQSEIIFLMQYFPNKAKKIVLAYETPDSDSANYCKELKTILEKYGYQVELFGHLSIRTQPQPKKIMIDTANYRVSVEWNYN